MTPQPLPTPDPDELRKRAAALIAAPTTPVRGLGPALNQQGEQAAGELGRLQSSPSGWQGIQNPALRGLAGTGQTILGLLAPGVARQVPGTTAHHNALIGQQQSRLAANQKAAGEEAGIAQKQAQEVHERTEANTGAAKQALEEQAAPGEAALKTAQTGEANARAKAISNPQPKEEEQGKIITTDQGIMQWNHETKRYDIKAGNSPEKNEKQTGTVHQRADGSLIVVHPDGTATAVTINGKPAQGPAKEPKEPPDHGQNFVDANGHMIRVEPGGTVPKGAVTPGGASTEAVGEAKRTETEKAAKEQAAKDVQTVQQFVDKPSPAGDVAIIMHFMGAVKPENLGKMRFNKNEQDYIEKTRSSFGDLQAFLQKVVNGQRLTPTERKDMVGTMKIIAGQGEQDRPPGAVEHWGRDANGKLVKQ